MAEMIWLLLCLLSFSFVNCHFGLLTNADSIGHVLRARRSVEDKVPSCPTVNNMPARCVDLMNQCPRLYQVVNNNRNNPKFVDTLRQLRCGFDDNKVDRVCCPVQWIPNAPSATTITPSAPTQPSDELPQRDALSQNTGDFVDTLPSPPVCGPIDNLGEGIPRVVGGVPAAPKMFPWMALLGYRRRWGTEWLCGGSLISTRHVLTAAHCIHEKEKSLFQVRLGELDLARDDDDATPIDIPIKNKIIHEQYDPEITDNDIGMVTLATEVKYTDYIKPICMPMRPDLRSNNFEDYMPFLAGWGQIKYRGRSATHLQYIQIPVTNTAECNEIYKKDDETFKTLDIRSLCAGWKLGRMDSCSGDSGGPLMQADTNNETRKTTFYQTGIISYGKGCGAPGYPGIYVRVTEYIPWIVKQTTGKIVS